MEHQNVTIPGPTRLFRCRTGPSFWPLNTTGQKESVPFISLASEPTRKILEQTAGREHLDPPRLNFLHWHQDNAPVRVIVSGKHLSMFGPAQEHPFAGIDF